MNLKNILSVSVKFLVVFTIITGIFYPLVITGTGQFLFPRKSNGSMVEVNGRNYGSELIAQKFEEDKYFRPRPSQTSYSALPSGGSNISPASIKLKQVSDSIKSAFIENNKLKQGTEIPSEMIFKSASGLDPHISRESAMLQTGRISNARKFNDEKKLMLEQLVDKYTEKPQFGILGEERINVLLINIELDKLQYGRE
jgi:potassium-transporting ATPase KdpC subunit